GAWCAWGSDQAGDLRVSRPGADGGRAARRVVPGVQAGRVPAPEGAQGRRAGDGRRDRHEALLPGQLGRIAVHPRLPGSDVGSGARGFSAGGGTASSAGTGEVMNQTTIAPVKYEVTVPISAPQAFTLFTEGFNTWWIGHHIGQADLAEAV